MDFSLPEYVAQRKRNARAYVEEILNPLSPPMEEQEKLTAEVLQKLRETEFYGLTIPQEYGGKGWTMMDWFPVLEEWAKGYAMIRLLAHCANGISWRPLYLWGNEAQKKKYLPKLASGAMLCANCLTEPETGTGRNIVTTATREGGSYVINGRKWLISFPFSQLYYIFAAAPEGITAFLVEAGTPGLRIKPMPPMMGTLGVRHGEVILENMRVSEEDVLGTLGQGLDVAYGALNLSRASIATCCVGLGDRLLDLSLGFAKKRQTFGKPIAQRQAIQWMLAEMGTQIKSTRFLAYEAAWRHDQGLSFDKEASMAKLAAEEMITEVSEKALRIHGGIGYTRACQVERIFRDVRSFHFEEGTTEIQKLIIARSLLGS
jgi:alkylation response protein AidB-like acyl-CoA dehydrogenase